MINCKMILYKIETFLEEHNDNIEYLLWKMLQFLQKTFVFFQYYYFSLKIWNVRLAHGMEITVK